MLKYTQKDEWIRVLHRVTLVRIIEESKYEDLNVTLNKLKEALLNATYKTDDDFIKVGRRAELYDDFYSNLENHPASDSNIISAINDLKDYIHGQSWIEMDEKVEVKNYEQVYYKEYKETVSKNERYKEKGIICEEEKDILLGMIETLLLKIKGKQYNFPFTNRRLIWKRKKL